MHDHMNMGGSDGMGMGMGGMSYGASSSSSSPFGGPALPDLFHLQRVFWAILGALTAFATAVNILNKLIARQRQV